MKLFSVIAKKLRRRTRVKGSTAKRVARHQPHNAATRLIESYYVMPWALKATSPTKANKRHQKRLSLHRKLWAKMPDNSVMTRQRIRQQSRRRAKLV